MSLSIRDLERGTPSLFDLWISVIDVLKLSWARANDENAKIGEVHLLHGLLSSPYAIQWMQAAQIDTTRLVDRRVVH